MGYKQLDCSDCELRAKKQAKRGRLLVEREAVLSGRALTAMLWIHLRQQWYSLSDPAMEEALIEMPTMRSFAGIEVPSDRIQDETKILSFRHLLERRRLAEQICGFAEDCVDDTGKARCSACVVTMRQGTIVAATLIAASTSTLTRAKPECAGGS